MQASIREKMEAQIDAYVKAQQLSQKVTLGACDRLEAYKRERDSLFKDSDGIFILIEGEARIQNKLDVPVDKKKEPPSEKDKRFLNLRVGDYFGETKFIKQQGFSYFGDIVAQGPATKTAGSPGIKRRNLAQDPKTVTVCMHLNQRKLYLLPFYDLLRLRRVNKNRQELFDLRRFFKKYYGRAVHNMKTQLLK